MVAEFFRRAGWNLCTGPFSSHQELTSLVHNHWFDVVGFSVSSDRRLDELKKDIHDIRRDSRNRSVGIMLGGPMVIAHPDLVATMGADMMSTDAAAAPQQARGLIEQMKSQTLSTAMTAAMADSSLPVSVVTALYLRTKALHLEAERTGIIRDLLRAKASREGYILLLRNLLPAYQAMEHGLERHRGSPGLACALALPT